MLPRTGDTNVCGRCGKNEYDLEEPEARLLEQYAFVQPICSGCRKRNTEKDVITGRAVRNAAVRAKKADKRAMREAAPQA
jgi:hypothetical protein